MKNKDTATWVRTTLKSYLPSEAKFEYFVPPKAIPGSWNPVEGSWLRYGYQCSNCGREPLDNNLTDFCPFCGKKMLKESDVNLNEVALTLRNVCKKIEEIIAHKNDRLDGLEIGKSAATLTENKHFLTLELYDLCIDFCKDDINTFNKIHEYLDDVIKSIDQRVDKDEQS